MCPDNNVSEAPVRFVLGCSVGYVPGRAAEVDIQFWKADSVG